MPIALIKSGSWLRIIDTKATIKNPTAKNSKLKMAGTTKKETFVKISEDHFTASVKEKAERNMANTRVRELVAEHFGVPVGKAKLVSGHHSPSKIFSVDLQD